MESKDLFCLHKKHIPKIFYVQPHWLYFLYSPVTRFARGFFFFILANEFTPHKPNRAAVQTWAAIQIIPYHGSGLGVDLAAADLPLPYCCLGEACGHGQEALPILGQREVKCLDASCAIPRPKNGLVSFIYSVSELYLLSPHWKDGWKALSHFLLRRITLSFFYFLLFHILAHWITVKIPIAL